jgi:hypothetical protein
MYGMATLDGFYPDILMEDNAKFLLLKHLFFLLKTRSMIRA